MTTKITVTLASGATSITLPAPSGTIEAPARKRQAIGRTAGGTVYAYDKGVDTYEVTVNLQSLTNTEKTNLESFFDTTVNGAVNTWTYTDENGNDYTARFLEPQLSFEKIAGGIWDIDLRLEIGGMLS